MVNIFCEMSGNRRTYRGKDIPPDSIEPTDDNAGRHTKGNKPDEYGASSDSTTTTARAAAAANTTSIITTQSSSSSAMMNQGMDPSTTANGQQTNSSQQQNRDDVIHDIIKKAQWSEDFESTLPKFELVRSNRKSIQNWCSTAKKVLSEYWGPTGAIVQSIVRVVDLPELKLDSFDASEFSIDEILEYIQGIWTTSHGNGKSKVLLVKEPNETWVVFLDRLKAETAGYKMGLSEEWYLDQLRANTTAAEDIFRGKEVHPGIWAAQMDAQAAVYNRVSASQVATIQVEEENEDKEEVKVNAIATRPKEERGRHKFTTSGEPICDRCGRVGHISRNCRRKSPARGGRSGRKNYRLVYTIDNDGCTPIVINVSVLGQDLEAMLDCGAMVNVMDIRTMRRLIPHVALHPFHKKLIGADNKPIPALGSAEVPISVAGQFQRIPCVAAGIDWRGVAGRIV